MNNVKTRTIFLSVGLFLGFLVAEIISEKPFTLKSLLPALEGGLVGGLVVYLVGSWKNRKNNKIQVVG